MCMYIYMYILCCGHIVVKQECLIKTEQYGSRYWNKQQFSQLYTSRGE